MLANAAMMDTGNTVDTPRKRTRSPKIPNSIDRRTRAARRIAELIAALSEEHGGKVLSATDLALVRQAATITLRIEQLQAAIIRGEAVDSDALIRLSSEARRILASLRIKAAGKPAAPSLAEHLARKAAERDQKAPA